MEEIAYNQFNEDDENNIAVCGHEERQLGPIESRRQKVHQKVKEDHHAFHTSQKTTGGKDHNGHCLRLPVGSACR